MTCCEALYPLALTVSATVGPFPQQGPIYTALLTLLQSPQTCEACRADLETMEAGYRKHDAVADTQAACGKALRRVMRPTTTEQP